ncbi:MULTISPECIES: hypothetical protein [unclassified Microbacterium]|uniref:hypothetical protein n=1 Tax=unclassified Microbacterium TaxID=2609290 RepID=UPI0012F7BA1F|nr:hypothetical protein [Microbacterium sp. MAH-37]MVQ42629.1 hypothetical protein [Microbacterium sp. MAH-37]
MTDNTEQSGISRRTVTKAMAWAVPAIAVAAPIPAFAASGPKPTLEHGPACKAPGGSVQGCESSFKFGYGVPVTITNPSNKDVWITSITITNQIPASPTWVAGSSIGLPVKVPANGSVSFFFRAVSTNSQNVQNGAITFSAAWGHEADGSDHDHDGDPLKFTVAWASTPPGCNCIEA